MGWGDRHYRGAECHPRFPTIIYPAFHRHPLWGMAGLCSWWWHGGDSGYATATRESAIGPSLARLGIAIGLTRLMLSDGITLFLVFG